jgi:hypothetical protein
LIGSGALCISTAVRQILTLLRAYRWKPSHTLNFAGTVLFCLKTLEPSELMGCRI